MQKVNLINNKRYMQLNSFWNDPHNKKMYDLGKDLYSQRLTLTSIAEANPKSFVQKNDGSLELKKRSSIAKFFSSRYERMFADDMNTRYMFIMNSMKQLAEKVKQKC